MDLWREDPNIMTNISAWEVAARREAIWQDLPASLAPGLLERMRVKGITRVYSHQAEALSALEEGQNPVISTGTASGKSLCYQLPILNTLLKDPQATALLVYPTKALAYDQYEQFRELAPPGLITKIFVYDGDTAQHLRGQIRKNARVILTNPDMLHMAILPHHTLWEEYLAHLQHVVLDEIHVYRGVFGSHVANVIRRLKRIYSFYGASPQYVLTSATISNPADHARHLIELPTVDIYRNGAPGGERNFLLYNPPLVNEDLGIRRSSLSEGVWITGKLLDYDVQTLMFARTRRSVELGVRYLRENQPAKAKEIVGYRSGYLAADRREIENELKSGTARAVAATNALELGVDIGSMDAVVIVGYPGTIAATRQQAGRAGRKLLPALSVFIASAAPLDQYLVRHPDFLLEKPTEQALINPDNPVILMQHLRCALFELPFSEGSNFGGLPWETVAEYMALFIQTREVHFSNDKYFWVADQYVSQSVSLRTTSPSTILLQTSQDGKVTTIGEVDASSAKWMVHPHAIYLHQAQSYFVEGLDLEKGVASLTQTNTDYFTEPHNEETIEKISEFYSENATMGTRSLGEIEVTTQVVGFRKVRWFSNENLGGEELSMPPDVLRTIAYWLAVDPKAVDVLEELNLWSGTPINYGPNWNRQRDLARERDHYTCQNCGRRENGLQHHVHHKIPFRQWPSYEQANRLENLVTLCPACHKKAEGQVRMRSGLAGLSFALGQLAPLFIMCDPNDLGTHADPQSPLVDGNPAVVLFDRVPAGIGLCEEIYRIHGQLMAAALDLVSACPCQDGCPSCVGVGGEFGSGGKKETLALLNLLNGKSVRV